VKARSICNALAAEFAFADRLHRYWLRRHEATLLGAGLSFVVGVNVHLLNVQALRLFRSVVDECQRCEGFSANILARSLYETLLAVRFILKQRLRIIATGKNGKYRATLPSKGNRGTKLDSLSREQRAQLYALHAAFAYDRMVRDLAKTPGLKRAHKRLQARSAQTQQGQAALEQQIGPEWCSVLQNYPYTYSGLKVAQLAEVVDPNGRLRQWYVGPYGVQSGMVHAAAAHRHIELRTDGGWDIAFQSSQQEIAGTLEIACMMLLACMFTLKDEARISQSAEPVFDAFLRDFRSLFQSGSST
jgi:hypothetical protein